MTPEVLTAADVRRLVPLAAALEPTRAALVAHWRGEVRQPSPWHLDVGAGVGSGEVHVKGAWIAGSGSYTVKLATGFPDNAAHGRSTSSGLSIVSDAGTGEPLLLCLDGGWLTEIRTAAAGALATDALSRPGPLRVAVIGAGVQAGLQLRALALLRELTSVTVLVRDAARGEAFAQTVADLACAVRVRLHSPSVAVDADAVITVTPARSPVLDAVLPGTHVTAVGADGPGKRELATRLVEAATLVAVDDEAQSRGLGELQGLDATRRPALSLGAVLAGAAPGRAGAQDVTIADLTGIGAQDAAMGELALARWRADGAA